MSTIKIKRTSGSTTPTGLTFGELAYVQGIKSIYIGQTAGDPALRIGAEVDTSTALGTSDNKIPSQNAVKTYVDSIVTGGAGLVTDINGVTGAVQLVAGTGIFIASAAGKNINISNSGVQSLTGTSNQISVSGSTGAVTLSLPSTVTVPGSLNVTTDLTVTGNLTVNGTSTTVNSNTMTVDDPIIVLGTSGGVPISASDGGKSRGVAFTYYDDGNTIGKTGFFGFRIPGQGAVFGAYERVNILNDATQAGSTLAMIETYGLSVRANQNVNTLGNHVFSSLSTTNNKQVIFEDHTGYVLIPNTLGTSGYIIKSNGGTSQPTWIDASAAGFTAYAATRLTPGATIALSGDVTATGVTFDGSGNITLTTTIAANSVALGTDTTGDYVAAVAVSGIGLSVAGSGENATYTVTSGATSNNVVSQIVARDASGNFSAGTITAALTGNASTASTLQTARSIGLTGDVSGSASFNGSADINITATIAANSVALGTDTTGNYVATLSTSSTGLTVANSGAESAAVTVNFATITSGLNMGTFSFASGEFTNSSGTISLGTVDGGSY
jgi:hypothetical protein